MVTKWEIRSHLLRVKGQRRWVWFAVAPHPLEQSRFFWDKYLFRSHEEALRFVVTQIEVAPALAEATA